MKVILIKDVKKLGKQGQVIEVNEGFGRNYLLPNKLVLLATPEAIKSKQDEIQRLTARSAAETKTALALFEKLTAKTYHFTLPADKNGHLYARLKEPEILAKISEGTPTLQNTLRLANYSPIKTAGDHVVTVEAAGIGSTQTKLSIKAQN